LPLFGGRNVVPKVSYKGGGLANGLHRLAYRLGYRLGGFAY
jgi:hypothetical protein